MVFDFRLDSNSGGVGGDRGSGNEGALVDEVVLGMGDDELDGGVDSAGVIPAGGGFFGVVDVDFDEVLSLAEVLGEVVVKGDVAVGSVAELLAIDGDGGVAIDAVEVEGDFLPGEAVR